jgi:hypothetical protein
VRVAISVLVTIFVEVVKIVRRIVAVVVVISVAVVVIVVGMVVVVVAVAVIVAVLVSVTVVVVVVAKVIALGHSLKYITSSPCGLLNTIEGVIELTVGVIRETFSSLRWVRSLGTSLFPWRYTILELCSRDSPLRPRMTVL